MTWKLCFGSILLAGTFFGTSCTTDYIDDPNNTVHYSDWCLVQGKSNALFFLNDKDQILIPNQTLDSTYFTAGYRCYVTYAELGISTFYSAVKPGKRIDVATIQPVFVEKSLKASLYTGRTADPVTVYPSPNIGGGFLNLIFGFKTSTGAIKHAVHLLQDSVSSSGKCVYVRLVHDAKGDTGASDISAIASFPLGSMDGVRGADSLIIRYLDGTKMKRYAVAFEDSI